MTYTFKLARRIARFRLLVTAAPAILSVACSSAGDPTSLSAPLLPPTTTIVALDVTPAAITLAPSATQQFSAAGRNSAGAAGAVTVTWTASGGTITAAGLYTAPAATGSYKVIATQQGGALVDTSIVTVQTGAATLTGVTITPKTASLKPAQTQAFAATGKLSDGSTGPIAVTWTASGGTISASGGYTAPSAAGTYTIIARQQTGTFADTATITVTPSAPVVLRIGVTPKTTSLATGATQQFSASAKLSDSSSTSVAVAWTATGGTISSTGLYTAPATAGSYKVVATQQGGALVDTAAVTVTAVATTATVVSIQLTPTALSLVAGAAQQFSVSGTFSNATTGPVTVTYAATGGTMSTSGLYTAGTTPGAFRVIATLQGGTLADTTAVTVTAPAPTVASIVLTPATASLLTGATQQFSAAALMSDNSTQPVSVTYSASGGTIATSGLYTAPATAGSYRVIATQQGGTKADTSTVTVTAPAPTLSAIVTTPATINLQTGGTQQFSTTGSYSDGSTGAVAVTYSATGGTVTSAGLYTAGTTAGSYRVIATQQSGTKADTSAVTIIAPATVTSLVMSPATVTLAPAATQQFAVTGQLSTGGTQAVTVTYTATGGTISTGGLYTAGATAGSFNVIATQQGGTLADTSAVTIQAAAPPPTGGTQIALIVKGLNGNTGTQLVSNGIPLTPGLLQASGVSQVRVYVRGVEQAIAVSALQGTYSDGSLRSVLVQFPYTFADTTGATGLLVIGGGARGTTDIALTTPPSLPKAVAMPSSPDYLVGTTIGGPLLTKAKTLTSPNQWLLQSNDFSTIANQQWPTPGASWTRGIAGYEYPLNNYQEWLRTGDLLWYQRANAMVMDYRTNYVDANGGTVVAWWSMTESLAAHYWLTGDNVSRTDVGLMASSEAMQVRTDGVSQYCWGCNQSDGRMKSRALAAVIDAHNLNCAYGSDQYSYQPNTLTVALSGILLNQNANGSWDGGAYYSGGQKNYMVAELMESLIRYYNEVSPDPRIPPVVKSSIDYAWTTQWSASAQAFNYVSINGSPSGDSMTPDNGLNGFWLYPMIWYAKVSGQSTYASYADQALIGARNSISGWAAFYKAFDENYWHVFNAMALR